MYVTGTALNQKLTLNANLTQNSTPQGKSSLQSALILARQVALEVVELMEGPAAGDKGKGEGDAEGEFVRDLHPCVASTFRPQWCLVGC